MRTKATIEVEFELNPGQPANVAHNALLRGINDLTRGIEYGAGSGMPTRIKHGSVKAKIIDEQTS